MRHVSIKRDFQSWRRTARALLAQEVPPEQVLWSGRDELTLLPPGPEADDVPPPPAVNVPAEFVRLSNWWRVIVIHSDGA
jgi:hypothetical protein